jgi:hypothetical protein
MTNLILYAVRVHYSGGQSELLAGSLTFDPDAARTAKALAFRKGLRREVVTVDVQMLGDWRPTHG